MRGHITSLKPIRPANAPDPWERQALLKVEGGAKEYHELAYVDGQLALRLLKPLYVEKPCLPCHQSQGYTVGQVRGGLGVIVPMEPLVAHGRKEIRALVLTHVVLWALTMLAILVVGVKLERRIAERDQARREAHTLGGLLPICSHCKKIRNDEGQWEKLESYISQHSEADFSHGLCPDCLSEHYPEIFQKKTPPKAYKKPDRANPVRPNALWGRI
ncbi:MAG: DUF3365 domain-containing protein [Desulfarculus sp.]|nr:DUF3365 domain-containing protein [Pseudomonadota bacterium]MBV1714698.1 DUF3365 domain-containing protein [Desulfarculus sp.]MBU4573616.1 DUF3365 domain-containing protein [Pseudomonadota bacterium]MBU4600034.1 DUF3365 domain-containing protein [Pseudomonadota bacterium]MBV1740235.1 DUF3365 domain-containing protein [Desulfarculus sp.]